MYRKRRLVLVSIVLMVALGIGGLQTFKAKTNKTIESYLINQKGYSHSDISEIYTQIGKAPLVSTTVIFSDDISSRYFYRKEKGRIYQYSMAPVQGVDDGHKEYGHKEE